MGINSSKLPDSARTTRVVVIGGSYAGRGIVHLLDRHVDITWIERRPALVHKMMIRSVVDALWIPLTQIPQDKFLKRGKLIQGNVTGIDLSKKSVTYEMGPDSQTTSIDYDYLVIASGATNSCPIDPKFDSLSSATMDNISSEFKSAADTIAKHKSIAVIGGGPVGCELAGEIKAKYPTTEVSIISKAPVLCSRSMLSKEGSDKIHAAFVKAGIKIFYGSGFTFPPNTSLLELSASDTLPEGLTGATLAVNCTGSEPNTSFVPSENLDPSSKLVKVNSFLQVSDCVFAIGDCNNVEEPKLFATAGTKKFMFGLPTGQADIAAGNILALLKGAPMKPYTPPTGKGRVILPIGPKNYVTVNAPGFFGKIKASTYFYQPQWKFANQTPPKLNA